MADTAKTYTALSPRNTNAVYTSTADEVTSIRNQKQILAVITSSLDAEITVRLLGTIFNDSSMTYSVIDTEITIADGSGTAQTAGIQSDAQWQYIDFYVKASTVPTAGSVNISMFAPKERR